MKLAKRVDLAQLHAELASAGISVPALGVAGDDLHTYDANGAAVALPPAAEAVIRAHIPPAPFIPPTYGEDAADQQGNQLALAVTALRQYANTDAPTAGQTVSALKLVIRLVLLLARSTLRRTGD